MNMRLIILFIATITLVWGGNFSDGMRAYRAQNYEKAKEAFEKAVEEDGAVQAHYFLGLLYLKGLGTTKNRLKAKNHFELAAQYGNARARCYLAEIYLKEHKKSRAVSLLKEGLKDGAQECENIAKENKISL